MSLILKTRTVGAVTILDASGRITLGEGSSALRDTVKQLLAGGNRKILLNLAEVTYVDSSGMGELVSAFTSVSNGGGELKLMGATKRIKDLLQITKLYTIFDIYDKEESAVGAFR